MVFAFSLGLLPHVSLGQADLQLYLPKRFAARRDPSLWRSKAVKTAVIMFADQQIVTGIAILVTGFVKMQDISVYHYNTVVYLGWLASITHLTCLTLLRPDLQKQSRRPSRNWRVCGMVVHGLMLLVALSYTFGQSYDSLVYGFVWTDCTGDDLNSCAGLGSPDIAAALPAKCLWDTTKWSGIDHMAPVSLIILLLSYVWKIASLFPSSGRFLEKWVRTKPLSALAHILDHLWLRITPSFFRSILYIVAHRFLACFYVIFYVTDEFLRSFLSSILLCGIGIAWGFAHVIIPRVLVGNMLKGENAMTFGQLTSLLLLALPAVSVLELYWGKIPQRYFSFNPYPVLTDTDWKSHEAELQASGSSRYSPGSEVDTIHLVKPAPATCPGVARHIPSCESLDLSDGASTTLLDDGVCSAPQSLHSLSDYASRIHQVDFYQSRFFRLTMRLIPVMLTGFLIAMLTTLGQSSGSSSSTVSYPMTVILTVRCFFAILGGWFFLSMFFSRIYGATVWDIPFIRKALKSTRRLPQIHFRWFSRVRRH